MLKSHQPVTDRSVVSTIIDEFKYITKKEICLESWQADYHSDVYRTWISQGTLCKVTGLDNFSKFAFTGGTTPALESFVLHWPSRRLRISQAEFVLPRVFADYQQRNWCYLEHDLVQPDDFVIISLPFSGNGMWYTNFDQLLNDCAEKSVPVCLDLAYIGIAYDMQIDLSHPAIAAVTTSISKPYSTMLRHGIRFTKERWDDAAQNTTELGIVPRANIHVASKVMTKYGRDYIPDVYLAKTKAVCRELGLTETNVITLALGDSDLHREFVRGGYPRVCITDEIET